MHAARPAALLLAVLAAGTSCGPSDEKPSAQPGAQAPAPRGGRTQKPPQFVDVAAEAGFTAVNHTGLVDPKDWLVTTVGGGVIVLDYDRDGRMDLVVVDGTEVTTEGDLRYDDAWRTRVYHNDGGLKFTDVTARSGVDLKAFGIGGASCDYDADGFPDFYVCCWGKNHLYRNRGDGTFEDVAEKAGVAGDEREMSTCCAWGDLNGDGRADLYVANYCDQRAFIEKCRREGKPGRCAKWFGLPVMFGPTGLTSQGDRLYFARADGTFEDVTAASLEPEHARGFGFQPVMTDIDLDGDLDVFVANDQGENFLWVNDGHGKFAERATQSGVAVEKDGKLQACMGVDVADVNRDGRPDIAITNLELDHNTLYENVTPPGGAPLLRDMSSEYNVSAPSYRHVSWGVRLLDYDNDGELDLFAACGHFYRVLGDVPAAMGLTFAQRCILERNLGPPGYAMEDVTDSGGPALQIARSWRGAAFADFDDDGDLDVFLTALNEPPALFRNDGGDRNEYVVFRLIGKGSRRDPSGARVTVRLADGRPHMEELHHGASFACDNDPRFFFGLGAETTAASVEVRWPDGQTQQFKDVIGRRFYVIEQGKDALTEEKH